MRKTWVKIALSAAAAVVVLLLLIPLFINAESLRPTVEAQLTSALGRKVTIGHLSFSLFSGSLGADDIQIADDPAFSNTPFIQAKSLKIGVETGALVFHRQVRIRNLTIDTPSIQLVKGDKGTWNFSSLGSASATPTSPNQSTVPTLTVDELDIKNGSATVSSIISHAKPSVYSNLDVAVQQFSFTKAFPFKLSADLPGNGHFELKGTGGPVSQKNAADTPLQATISLKQFDIVGAGVVEPSEGISMVLDLDAQLNSDGTTLTNTGKLKATRLHLARGGHAAETPVDIDYAVSTNLDTESGSVNDIAVHTGSIAAHVKGTYQVTPQGANVDLHVSAPGLPVDALEKLLPAFGITLPSGSKLEGGSITTNLTITGPVSAPTIAGPVELDNSKLAGFDLGSRISGINPFGGSGGGTQIQKLRADVNSSPQLTRLANIDAEVPQVGSATGNGTVTGSEALDFKLMAKFNPSSGVGMVAGKTLNVVADGTSEAVGRIGGLMRKKQAAKPAASNGEIPVTITGTTSNPNIKANVVAMFK